VKIRYIIDRGISGADIQDEFEMPDGSTEEEIDEAVRDELWNRISFSWEIVE